jgi:hypothetical protein
MIKQRIKNITTHVLAWLFLITLYYCLAYLRREKGLMFVEYFAKYLLVIPVFYLNIYLILPKFFQKGKIFKFAVGEILLSLFCYVCYYLVYKFALPALFDYPKLDMTEVEMYPRSLWWYFNFSLYGFGFWYAKQAIAKQKRIAILERQNFIAETNFLKSQINPHFLHNTLNMLYSQAIQFSRGLGDNIMRLSNMMRYSLESIEREDGKVLLKDEIQYMNDLIQIHQVRFSNELQITYEQTGHLNGQVVPALCLITPIENCMKYADLRDEDNPLFIKADILPDGIHFLCKNKKKENVTAESHGTGIGNLRKRLDFLYQDKYQMLTENKEHYYTFELTIHN